MSEDNFIDKLNQLKKISGLKQYELAERLGVTHTYISAVFNGKPPGKQFVIQVDLLLDKFLKEQHSSNASQPFPYEPYKRVPVISWARAGYGIDYEDLCRQIEEYIGSDTKDPNAYALIIEGDSMEPKVEAGDIVVFEPNSIPRNNDLVVARLTSGEVFFKKYRQSGPEGQKVILESFNPEYAPKTFERSDFRFIHPAVNLVKRFRR